MKVEICTHALYYYSVGCTRPLSPLCVLLLLHKRTPFLAGTIIIIESAQDTCKSGCDRQGMHKKTIKIYFNTITMGGRRGKQWHQREALPCQRDTLKSVGMLSP